MSTTVWGNDISPEIWAEIEKAVFTVNGIHKPDGRSLADRAYSRQVVEVGELRDILRQGVSREIDRLTSLVIHHQAQQRMEAWPDSETLRQAEAWADVLSKSKDAVK